MKKNVKSKFNIKVLKSAKGFTMTDLILALSLVTLLFGIVTGLFLNIGKINAQSKMLATATYYGIRILEDIDKTAYENVTPEIAQQYANIFSANGKFEIQIDVENYEATQDIIKKVKLTISYTVANEEQKVVFNKLKVKEIEGIIKNTDMAKYQKSQELIQGGSL